MCRKALTPRTYEAWDFALRGRSAKLVEFPPKPGVITGDSTGLIWLQAVNIYCSRCNWGLGRLNAREVGLFKIFLPAPGASHRSLSSPLRISLVKHLVGRFPPALPLDRLGSTMAGRLPPALLRPMFCGFVAGEVRGHLLEGPEFSLSLHLPVVKEMQCKVHV